MKKLFSLLFLASLLFGADGYKVFQQKCASCHIEMITQKETIQRLKSGKLKAPPMVEISNRIKSMIEITDEDYWLVHRRVVIAFIKDYITNPKLDDSMCREHAKMKFGAMPPIGKSLSEDEKQAVAEWIYDRYEGVDFE